MARLMNVGVHIPAPWCHASHHASHHGWMLGSMFLDPIRGLPWDGPFFGRFIRKKCGNSLLVDPPEKGFDLLLYGKEFAWMLFECCICLGFLDLPARRLVDLPCPMFVLSPAFSWSPPVPCLFYLMCFGLILTPVDSEMIMSWCFWKSSNHLCINFSPSNLMSSSLGVCKRFLLVLHADACLGGS